MKKLFVIFLIVAIVASGLVLINNVKAATDVSGEITTDTTWTLANSPYSFTGPVTIDTGVKLTIEAGATVNISTYYLQVNGTLYAKGTSASNINFVSNTSSYTTQINFASSSVSWNEEAGTGCIIENAQINALIAINGASPKINSNTINDNTASTTDINVVVSVSGGSAVISNNNLNGAVEVKNGGSPKVSSNKITGGMSLYRGSPVVSYNNISGGIGNDVIAITQESAPTVSYNTITGNTNGVAFNMHNNGYSNNSYSATITNNTISNCPTGIGIGNGAGNILLSSNTIFGSETGIAIGSNIEASTTIEYNLIMNNTYGIDVGSQTTIQKNTILNNTIGIYYESENESVIIYNNIQNNIQYNLKLSLTSPTTVNATYNWWGTTDIPKINQTIYDSKNNTNLGTVVFLPALSQPSPEAPTVPNYNLNPTPSPTPSPTPTATPTGNPTATPHYTAQPTETAAVTETGFGVLEILIIVIVIIIALLAVAIFLIKRRQ